MVTFRGWLLKTTLFMIFSALNVVPSGLWMNEISPKQPEDESWGGPVFSLAVRGETLYFIDGDRVLYAVDIRSKKVRWRFKGIVALFAPAPSAPEELHCVSYTRSAKGDRPVVHALDAKTGEEKWKFTGDSWRALNSLHPVPGGGVVLDLQSEKRTLCLVDSNSGKVRWKSDVISSPFVEKETIFFAPDERSFCSVEVRTGRTNWKIQTRGNVDSGNRLDFGPLGFDGAVFFGCKDDHLYAVSMKDGKVLWKFPQETRDDLGESNLNDVGVNQLFVTDGMICFTNLYEGGASTGYLMLYALDMKTGRKLSKMSTGYYKRTPIISGGVCYTIDGLDEKLSATDLRTGAGRWVTRLHGDVPGTFLFDGSGDLLLLQDKEGFAARSKATGKEIWRLRTPSDDMASPPVSGGILYFEYEDKVYGVDIRTGKIRWRLRMKELLGPGAWRGDRLSPDSLGLPGQGIFEPP